MSTERLFLSERSRLAADLLIRSRRDLDGNYEYASVLLACLAEASVDSEYVNAHETPFGEICRAKFEEYGGHFPKSSRVHCDDAIACGWFGNPIQALGAAIAIQRAVSTSEFAWPQRFMISVGNDEISAFRLLRLAGEDQVIVHPTIWEELSEDAKRLLPAANVHQPDFESLQTITSAIAGYVAGSIPWEDLPAPSKTKAERGEQESRLAAGSAKLA